ncbi:MAG: hypothetical protein RLZZ602_1817 [Pseudomonadota bacterium]
MFDFIIHPDWVVPIIPRGQVLESHSIAVKDGRIAAILTRSEARNVPAEEHIELPGQAVMPGLINCHGHSAMALLRGFADDYTLMTWLNDHIWPAEGAFVSESFVRDGTDLALAELLLGGTTTFSDNYFFPEVAAERADLVGLRAQLVFPIIDIATAWARNGDEYLARGLSVRDSYRDHDRIEIGFGPHSTYGVSEATLNRVATLANELDVPVQIHLHETRGEIQMSVENTGQRPIDILQRIGLLGPRTQCVHMTTLCDEDIAAVVEANSHVIHCPRSNMKLASGTCPTQRLLDAGINVALGTDGAASNNRLNMLNEMQTAALLAKLHSGEPTALSAVTALEMATINGARALGYESRIGSIEVGKAADLIAIDLSGPATQPVNNVISQLVYATNGSELTHSWVAGRALIKDGKLITLDQQDVIERAQKWRETLSTFRQSKTATTNTHN